MKQDIEQLSEYYKTERIETNRVSCDRTYQYEGITNSCLQEEMTMITIRSLQEKDADKIVAFNENTDEDFIRQWAGRFYTYPLSAEQITERMKNTENTRLFAVLLDGDVIGMSELDFIKWDEKECSVCRFILGKEFRGKGYGIHVINLLCDHAFDVLSMKKVKLTVFDFNTGAYKCYVKAGFKTVGEVTRPNGWKAIEMVRLPVVCRMATVCDIELLSQARAEFFADVHKDMTDSQKAEIYNSNKAYFIETLGDNTFTAWLAFDGDTLIATSGVNFFKTPPNPKNPTGKTAYISNMFTKLEYRGKGIATRLFALTVGEARKRGCGKVVLHATDAGRPVYEKYGFFVPHGAMEYYFTNSGVEEK